MDDRNDDQTAGSDSGADLQAIAQRWLDGSATSEELLRSFLAATLFLQATEQPGFMAIGEPPEGLVPVWTTEAELARSLGAAAWFSTNGADLLDLLPPGYDLLLDPDGDSALRLRPSALRREQAVTVVWE